MSRITRLLSFLVLATTLPATLARAQSTLPAGPEFQVNAYTTGDQAAPAVATAPDGTSLVVWQSAFQDGSGSGVYGRRASRTGDLGPEFLITTATLSDQVRPTVAVDANGRFTVVWSGVDAGGSGIFARQFSATAVLGPEFQVNTYTTGDQSLPRVAATADGVAVVWQSAAQDGSGLGVYGRLFGSTGAPLTGEVALAAATAFDQSTPAVGALDNGRFAVAWLSKPSTFGLATVSTRLFDPSLAPLTPETTVAVLGPGQGEYQQRDYVRVVPGVQGTYWIGFWEAAFFGGKDTFRWSDYGVELQAFDAGGTAAAFRDYIVAGGTINARYQGAAAVNRTGRLIVAYTGAPLFPCFSFPNNPCPPPPPPEDGSGAGVFITARGPGTDLSLVRMNTFTVGDQSLPVLAQDARGNSLVAWQSAGQDGSGYGVYARRLGGLFPAGIAADGDGVFDPGAPEVVQTSWLNRNGAAVSAGGLVWAFVGPAGGTYAIGDSAASFGSIADGTTQTCTDCYGLTATFPGGRPAGHLDAFVGESLTPAQVSLHEIWTLHIGGSFSDVTSSSPFYRFVETLLHNGISNGCGGGAYCPAVPTTREQMSVFVLTSKESAAYHPPACTTPLFADVPAASPFCPWVEELARRGVTTGCGGGNYCPANAVSREQMAVFVLRTMDPALSPAACTTPLFADVPAGSPFCRWIEEMARRGITGGCGGGNFCPTAPVTREQMATFLTAAFGLRLY